MLAIFANLLVLTCPLSGPGIQEEGGIRSLSRHPWARWKPGSSVKIENLNNRFKSYSVTVLKKTSETTVTIDNKLYFNGKLSTDKIKEEQLGLEYVPVDPAAKKTGEEKIVVEGKEYSCEVWEVAIPGKSPMERKVWVTAAVPMPLKLIEVSKAKFGAYRRVLTATKLSEKVDAAGRSINCVRLEGITTYTKTGKKTGWTRWVSLDVPGGYVKEERRPQVGRASVSIVTAFEGKK